MTDALTLITRALAGRYTIDRLVGEGGFATVYAARDERHRRVVAVKLLRPELARSIGVERFSREIEIAARLNHPHILPLLDSGMLDLGPGAPAGAYYVMPFVSGESLRQRLARAGRLELAEALQYGREVASALDYAHRQGVIHRDIKPENILLSEGHAVVADFGIARAFDEAGGGVTGGLTGADHLLGTPTYMSPEQVTGDQAVDGRSDIYSLACTLFETLVGQPPWTGSNPAHVMTQRLTHRAPHIRTILATIPQQVDDALSKALSISPDHRFATAAEFGASLGEGGTTTRGGWRRTGLIALASAAAAVAVLLTSTRLARTGRADAVTSLAIAPQPGDSSVQYLSEGIQEGVADQLRQLPQLRVMAPSVVAQVRAQEPAIDHEQLGRRLRVGAVLTWELMRSRDSVRVRVELLRVPGGDLLWSGRLARPAADLAMLPGTIASLIADSLQLQLTGTDRARMARAPTASAAAYDLYIRGRRFQLRAIPLGGAGVRDALDSVWALGRRAIEIDSNFGPAHALLGMYYFQSALRGFKAPFQAYIDSGLAFANRALALDSALGDPWLALMSRKLYLDDDWEGLARLARTAARLTPFDPAVQIYLGIYQGEIEGRLDSAITLLRRSSDVDPSTQALNTLGDLYLRAGKNDSAIGALRRAIAIDSTVPGPHRRLVLALERSGRYAEAAAERHRMGDTTAALYAQRFREEGAAGYQRTLADELRGRIALLTRNYTRPFEVPRDTIPPTREAQLAALHAQAGNWTAAMDWIVREREHRPRRFRVYAMNPEFMGLRQDPRFAQLVREDGLDVLIRRIR